MRELIFASNNKGKIVEIQHLVNNNIKIISLQEAGIAEEIEEPFDTFAQNARAKADYVYRKTGIDCFADDSGLVVPALGGAPGVYSARYAGSPTNDAANNHKLLEAMRHVEDRQAYYQSVICLISGDGTRYFEGRCQGTLTETPRGDGGFGYDPLFVPDGYTQTFAELPLAEKSKISHRAAAMRQLCSYLNQQQAL